MKLQIPDSVMEMPGPTVLVITTENAEILKISRNTTAAEVQEAVKALALKPKKVKQEETQF